MSLLSHETASSRRGHRCCSYTLEGLLCVSQQDLLSSQPRRPTFAFLKKVLRMPLASQQLLPHRRYQGTSLIKSGALGLPHKPHLPCRLGKRYPAVYFSCVSRQLVSTVSPIGKDSADGRGADTRQSLPQALQNAYGPVGSTLPSPAHFQNWPCRHLVPAGSANETSLSTCHLEELAVCIQNTLSPPPVSQRLQLNLQQ